MTKEFEVASSAMRSRRGRVISLGSAMTALLALMAWTSTGAAPDSAVPILFEGARLISGDGLAPVERSAILVEDGRFAAVGRAGEVRPPTGARRIDLTGKTIIPGLVLLHGHVGYLKGVTFSADNYTRDTIIDQLNRYLYYGIVAVMSTGTDPGDLPFELRNGSHPGALFRTAGRGLAAPNASTGNLAMREAAYAVSTEDEARRHVQELARRRVDFVKVWVDDRNGTVQKLSPALYRAIIDEAHKRGLRVMAHVFYLDDARDLVAAGVDGFLHLVRDQEMDAPLVQRMKDQHVFVTPNLGGSEAATYTATPGWLADPRLAETTSVDERTKVARVFESRASRGTPTNALSSFTKQQRSLERLNAAGVPIALGDDSGIENTFFGYAEHHELELMVAAGMTPMQVIVAATKTPAELLRLDKLGTVAPGKQADFVVLDANPLDNIANAHAIDRVYQRGVEIDRAAMRAAWNAGRSQ